MGKKVLICDDEAYILEAVQYVVRRSGFEPLLAQNGEEALTITRKEKPDMIILDIIMPKINGFDVCRQLKSDPVTRKIYIAMLTARGYESDSLTSQQCGADEFITKPFSPQKLQQRLYEILGNN